MDVDNTLWNFCDVWYNKLKTINEGIPPIAYWTWDVPKQYVGEAGFHWSIDRVHEAQDQYKPYPEAEVCLKELSKDYYITIATHRKLEYQEQLITFLSDNNLMFDDVYCLPDKTVLFDYQYDVVVDDDPRTLLKARDRGLLPVGLKFPWNKHLKDGIILFDNLSEITLFINIFDGE